MTKLIPVTEGVIEPERISPEGLEVANSYLVTNSLSLTAQALGLPAEVVADTLKDPFVEKYINTVYMDTGYRNRFNIASALDDVIAKKIEEMEEAEISSSKDISELLTLAHKMRVDEMKLELERLKLEASLKKSTTVNTGTTINIQDNSMGGNNYNQLMDQLLKQDKK